MRVYARSAGGTSTTKTIAALAEARHLGVVPHNALSPVSTAACLQVGACIPIWPGPQLNQSGDPGVSGRSGRAAPERKQMVIRLPVIQASLMMIPNTPGIGVELAPDAATTFPPKPRAISTRLNRHG